MPFIWFIYFLFWSFPFMAGGKYDLLVHFLYSWSTYVCASLLPWLDEQKRETWINYWPPRCPCGWDYSGSKLAVDMVLNIVHCRVTSSCIWHDMLIWFKFHFVPLLAAPGGGGWFHLEPYTFSSWLLIQIDFFEQFWRTMY